MKTKVFLSLFLSLAMVFAYTLPVYAIPALPHAFYGDVDINGLPAPDGSLVSAMVSEGDIVSVQNPVATVGGSFGKDSPKLLVQGTIQNGATITFHVTNEDGTAVGGTDIFEIGGGPTECNLSVNIAEPEPEPTPSVYRPASPSIEVDLFGEKGTIEISSTGVILETIVAVTDNGELIMTIPEGTKALDKDGKPLNSLRATVASNVPDPPANSNVIGLAYDFGPDGATFDPVISIVWEYDSEALPEGTDENNLVLAYYDEVADEWIELSDCVVDIENGTVTASISHFTKFALIGPVVQLPVVEPEEPEEPVVEEPEAPEVEEPEEPVVEEPEEPVVEEPEEPVVEEPEEPATKPTNWVLIISAIVAGVVALVVIVIIVIKRRYRYG